MDFHSHLFPTLQFLDLSMNELFGTIPIEISKLSKLTHLDLSSNNTTRKESTSEGKMPSQKFEYPRKRLLARAYYP